MSQEPIKFERDRESTHFQQLLSAWKSFYFSRLENPSVEDEDNFKK